MNAIVIGIALNFVVGEIADFGEKLDGAALKAKVNTAIEGAVHSRFIDQKLETAADAVVDAVVKALQDKPDMKALLQGVANQDLGAAKGAVVSMVKPLLSSDLAGLLSAA